MKKAGPWDGVDKETNFATSRIAWQRPQVSPEKIGLADMDFS